MRGIKPNPARVNPILKINKIAISVPANKAIFPAIIILGITKKINPPLITKISPIKINL